MQHTNPELNKALINQGIARPIKISKRLLPKIFETPISTYPCLTTATDE